MQPFFLVWRQVNFLKQILSNIEFFHFINIFDLLKYRLYHWPQTYLFLHNTIFNKKLFSKKAWQHDLYSLLTLRSLHKVCVPLHVSQVWRRRLLGNCYQPRDSRTRVQPPLLWHLYLLSNSDCERKTLKTLYDSISWTHVRTFVFQKNV